jgi:hypothetical protein
VAQAVFQRKTLPVPGVLKGKTPILHSDNGNDRKRVLKRLAKILDLPNRRFRSSAAPSRRSAKPRDRSSRRKACYGMRARQQQLTYVCGSCRKASWRRVDSIHGELRKPSTAVAEASKIAASLRTKKQRRFVRKNA